MLKFDPHVVQGSITVKSNMHGILRLYFYVSNSVNQGFSFRMRKRMGMLLQILVLAGER
jgi:hypothetical protein